MTGLADPAAPPGRATAARRVALDVLRRVRAGEFADRALGAAAARLRERERAWTLELAYGTLRLRGRLDHWLGALVRGGLPSLDPEVLDVLRLGAYQLREMGGVPAYAAVSQSVELARDAGSGRAAGLVNGVLQALRRGGDRIRFPDPVDDPLGHATTWGSHPDWLVARWLERWGVDAMLRLVEANNRRPDVYLRPIGVQREEALRRLAAGGVPAEVVPWAPDALRLADSADTARALACLPAVVQDPAAAWVARYGAPAAGAEVLDLCAAPGGKALAFAERAGWVIAADISPARLEQVRENVARVGWEARVALVAADARTPPFRPSDVVLLDAPCTGTGTLARHPDARWRIAPADLVSLAALQRELLRAAATTVRPGGLLIYSTCSLEREENELQVERFLAASPGWALDPGAPLAPEASDGGGYLMVLPQRTGTDGAFAARLRRAP